MIERQTAKKVRVAALMRGRWIKNEGMEPSFIETEQGDKVARARLLGTAVAKFIAEDQSFASLTLDDGTDTIRLKTFKDVKPLDKPVVGEVVDVIGKVREWNGEVYVIPEVVAKVEDPNIELLRRLEVAAAQGVQEPQDGLREQLLGIISEDKAGITYEALLKRANWPEKDVEKVVDDLLAEGVCYEPTPGKIKKI